MNERTPTDLLPEDHPYKQHLHANREQAIQNILGGLKAVNPLQPDTVGQAMGIRDTQLPNSSALEIAQDPALIQQKQHDDRVAEVLRENPSMIQWLQVPENAAVSHDEIENLNRFSQFGVKEADDDSGEFTRGLSSVPDQSMMMVEGLRGFFTAERTANVETSLQAYAAVDAHEGVITPATVREIWQRFSADNEGAVNAAHLGDFYQYAMGDADTRAAIKQGKIDTVLENEEHLLALTRSVVAYKAGLPEGEEFSWDNFGNWAQFQAGAGLPMLLAAIGIGATTGGAGVITFGGGVALGGSASEALAEGVDITDADFRDRALLGALASGGLEAAFGPVSRALKGVPADVIEEAARSKLKAIGREFTSNAMEEAAQEIMQDMLQEWAVTDELEWTTEALMDRFEAGVAGALLGGPAGAVMSAPAVMGADRRAADEMRGELEGKSLDEINEVVTENKLRDRSGPKFRQFLQQSGFDQRSLYVDANVINEIAQERPAVLLALGVTNDALTTAVENGTRVNVNLATYIQNVPGRDEVLAKVIADNATQTPDAPSRAQAQEYAETEGPERQAEATAARADARLTATQREQVAELVREQLEAAGQAPTAAKAGGELHGSFMLSMSERYGSDEVFGMFDLQIGGPGAAPAAGRILNQSDAFRAWAGTADEPLEGSEVNDAAFTGSGPWVVRAYHGTTHQFEEFDAGVKGTKEGQFGAVNYFTTSAHDANENYAGTGPDLTNRLENLRERLHDRIEDYWAERVGDTDDLDTMTEVFEDLAVELSADYEDLDTGSITLEDFLADDEFDPEAFADHVSRTVLDGGDAQLLEVFVRTEKPFVIGAGAPFLEFVDHEAVRAEALTRVAADENVTVDQLEADPDTYEDLIMEAEWEVQEETENQLVEAINTVAERYPNMDAAALFDVVMELSAEGGSPAELEALMRGSAELQHVEDDEGNLVGSHALSEIIQELGFDSIVLKDADARFSGMSMEPGTVHVHVFDTDNTNIKSVDNEGTFDRNDPRILKQGERGRIAIPAEGVLNGTTVIELAATSDLSTFLHESGHFFLEAFQALAGQDGAPPALRSDMATINTWLGRAEDDSSTFSTAQQEQWAEGFEKYLMEGKAPSPSLKVVFAQFARWLTHIYKSATNIGDQPLTAEIRQVMDRMLATREELDATVSALDAGPLFTEVPPGMSQQEFETYRRVAERSDAEAQGRALERAMTKVRRQREREFKARVKELEQDLEEEVLNRPEHQLIRALGGLNENFGDGARLDRKELVELFGEAILDDLKSTQHKTKRNLYTAGGVSPEVVAETFGYKNAGTMMNAIRTTAPAQDVIAAEARAQADQELGGELEESSIRQEAEAAIKNPYRQERAAREVVALNKAAGRKPSAWQAINRAAADKATKAIDGLTVREIMGYRQFLRDSQKHAREAQRELARVVNRAERKTGTASPALAKAAAAKTRQLEADHMYRIGRERAQKIESARKRFNKLGKKSIQQNIGPQFMDAIDQVLNRYDLRVMGLKQVGEQVNLMEFHQQLQQGALAAGLAFDPAVVSNTERKHYTLLSGAEMAAVIDTVDNMIHMGRSATKMKVADKVFDVKMIMDDIGDRIQENLRGDPPARSVSERKKSKWATGIRHSLINADTMIEEIDHGDAFSQEIGPARRALKQNIDAAHDRLDLRRTEVAEQITALYKNGLGGHRGMRARAESKKVYPTLENDTLSKMDLIMLALNSGNEGNFSRITYNPNDLRTVLLAELTVEEWQFVQDTWDYIDSFWPEIDAKHREMTGLRAQKVDARIMFEGAPDFVKGGYFPIRYDKDLSGSAENIDRAQMLLEGKSGSFMKAQTANGHTKQRQDTVNNKELLLDPSIIENHVFNVVFDLEMGQAVSDAGKVIYSDQFKAMLNEKGRGEDSEYWKTWLEDVAIGEHRLLAHTGAGVIRWMRSSVSMQALGFNLSSAIAQVTGLLNTFVGLGPKHAMIGFTRAAMGGEAEARAASPFMQERIRTFNRDINELSNLNASLTPHKSKALQNLTKVQQILIPVSMWAMQQVQFRFVDVPTWLGAYDRAVTEGLDAADAAARADLTVRQLQGSGRMTDRSALERGRLGHDRDPHAAITMVTPLYSFMNAMLNLNYLLTRGGSKALTQSDYLTLGKRMGAMIAIVYGNEVLYNIMKQGLPDEEKDEDWGTFFGGLAWSPLNLVPGGREALTYMRFRDAGGPAANAIKITMDAAIASKEVATGEDELLNNWPTIMEGIATGLALPMSQAIKIMEDATDPDKSASERQSRVIRRLAGQAAADLVTSSQ